MAGNRIGESEGKVKKRDDSLLSVKHGVGTRKAVRETDKLEPGNEYRSLNPFIPDEKGTALIMACHSGVDKLFSVKFITLFDNNRNLGLPLIQAMVILSDAISGIPLAIMDGGALTAIRTGAASGAATDMLARPDAHLAVIFGAGVQARTQLEAVCSVRPIRQAKVFDRGKPNLGIYLKGHAGDDVQVNRIGRPEEFIEKPALSVGLLCQPDLLRDIAKQRTMKGRGLLARFLWSMPRSIVGNRDIHPRSIDDRTKTAYSNAIWGLLSVGLPDEGPYILRPDRDAGVLLDVFRGDMEGRLIGDCEPFQDWAGKLAGLVCRLAAVIHGYTHPADYFTKPIDAAAMDSAIQIASYAIEHARYVFGALGADPTVAVARKIAGLLAEYGTSISRREIYERVKGLADVQSSDDLVEPLRILCEHGYIRPIIEKDKGRGRPSEPYEINPGLPGIRSQNSQ